MDKEIEKIKAVLSALAINLREIQSIEDYRGQESELLKNMERSKTAINDIQKNLESLKVKMPGTEDQKIIGLLLSKVNALQIEADKILTRLTAA